MLNASVVMEDSDVGNQETTLGLNMLSGFQGKETFSFSVSFYSVRVSVALTYLFYHYLL